MNKAFLIGNLTRDPESTTTPTGVNVCKFSIAVNRKFANADGTRDTDFFNIVAWRQLGENVQKYLTKGKKAAVVGQIQVRQYEHEGVKKTAIDIVADEIEFLSPANSGERGANGDATDPSRHEMIPVDDANLPF